MSIETIRVFCRSCGDYHVAELLSRDEDGWPERTRLLAPCSADRLRLGEEAGAAFAIAVAAGDWPLADRAAALGLAPNDPPGRASG